jgi:hypothetical protein
MRSSAAASGKTLGIGDLGRAALHRTAPRGEGGEVDVMVVQARQ